MTIVGMSSTLGAQAAGQPWYVVVSMCLGAVGYVIAQGVTDHGKTAALIVAAATKGVAVAKS